jgi:hypothetical protein
MDNLNPMIPDDSADTWNSADIVFTSDFKVDNLTGRGCKLMP